MNYLLDKKIKRKKFSYVVALLALCLALFYFRSGIWNGLTYASHKLFLPFLVVGNNVGDKFGSLKSYLASKNALRLENENLKLEINEKEALVTNYDSILTENISLKEILGRSDKKVSIILAAILSKPNQSPYDTLVIDIGAKEGIKMGNMVFALGNVPIGAIAETYANSSKVILFSNSGEKTEVVLGGPSSRRSELQPREGGNVFMEITGRGGGNFEMILPRDFAVVKGDQVVLPGITPYVVGIVETIISDPRDPFQKALLVSPVNIQELKFVEVEK